MKKFAYLFGFEVFVVLVATQIFKYASRSVAGAIASSCFLLIGLTILVMGLREPKFRRTFTFFFGCLHLLIAILIAGRFATMVLSGKELMIFGYSPKAIHAVSGVIYSALMISALVDGILAYRRESKAHRA